MSAVVEYINPPGACPAQGLYAHATRVEPGRILYIAGQLSVAADGSVAGVGDFAAQFAQVFRNLGDVIRGLGAGYDDVVKFTTYLTSPDNLDAFMKLRAELFPKIFAGPLYPPNTLLIVSRLVKPEFLIEVEATVRKPD